MAIFLGGHCLYFRMLAVPTQLLRMVQAVLSVTDYFTRQRQKSA
ncbi:hypothetical protein [Desmonostoc muscorum]|nr:hypothetical protein [Desmonostoc muscorum]